MRKDNKNPYEKPSLSVTLWEGEVYLDILSSSQLEESEDHFGEPGEGWEE